MATNNNTLEAYAQPNSQASIALDVNTPLSFRDWYKSRTGLIPGQEYIQYNTYLVDWYQNKQKTTINSKVQLQLTYLSLIKQLQIFSNTDETEKWYSQINFENEKEILIAIPYFAKKLKDIALYYLQLRETIKDAKINYNHIGTNKGIIQQLQKTLLTSFTKKQNKSITLPASLWTNVAELSTVKDSLVLTIEELYDDHHYGDQSSTLPASAYYNLNDPVYKKYFETKNLPVSSTEWIYKQGDVSINLQDVLSNIDLAEKVFTKYIGEEKYIDLFAATGTSILSTQIDFYNVFINEGLNTFFWPYGPYKPDVSTATKYESLALTAANIENLGTPSANIVDADTIFVKTAEGIEGAWLRYKQYEETNTVMETYIEGNKQTVFKFPYPGFGLSAEDITWSGPSVKYTPEFYYLEKDIKKLVEKEYWNLDVSLSGADSIKIGDTALITQGAYASNRYDFADKIRVRKIPALYNDSAGYGEIQEAWLYKMTKTDIPLAVGNNLLVWPYERITNERPFPDYFPSDITTICQPVNLSGINLPFATSSNSITGADVIYKLTNYTDNQNQAVECAWLSGAPFSFIEYGALSGIRYIKNEYSGISQPGFNSIFEAGNIARFVWEGPDLTNANSVFKSIQHQPDCTFFTTASTYQQHELCTCRSVLFTPFGHPGIKFSDNNSLADYIIELQPGPDSFVNFNRTSYSTTSAFAYFKTNKKIGWGDGKWHTNSRSTNNNFYLRKGQTYAYSRATDPKSQTPQNFPYLITRYSYPENNTVWIGAKKVAVQSTRPNQDDPTTTWVSTDKVSDMVLQPGDILLYVKANSTQYNILSSYTTLASQPTAINYGSIWTNYDFVTVGNGIFGIPQTVVVSYPINNAFYPFGALADPTLSAQYLQYPPVFFGNVLTTNWTVTDPEGFETVFSDTFSFTFTPLVTGLYSIAVDGISANKILPNAVYLSDTPENRATGQPVSGTFEFTLIPEITAGDYIFQSTSVTVSSYSRPVPGFIINTPLYGWNYNFGLPDRNSAGAKPYWAQGNLNYKDVISWGASFRVADGYNIVTQPFFSDIILETGNYIEYDRKYQKSFFWNQPINYKIQINQNIWSTIQIVTTATSNLEPILNNLTNQAIAIPTNNVSPIQLTNIVQNQPVEIFYKSIDSFTWGISAIPEINNSVSSPNNIIDVFNPLRPWNNLTNRFYPNFAIFPSLDSLYSANDKGGFFTPNNLGISVYTNKNYTPILSVSSEALSAFFEIPTKHIGGRGFTLEDQITPYYNSLDNNVWLKEPVVSGPIAGTIKKNVTKKYQKFIPYQSAYDSNPKKQAGIIIPLSRQTPWGGYQDTTWTDFKNKPQNFSGVVSVSAWTEAQTLKQQQNKLLDNWVTDIFGNQYGLYKEILNVSISDRKDISGELWVRKNTQLVQSAKDALSGVFDSYKNTSIYNDLTGTGINKVDVFFDTLYIETTGAIIFEDLDYNYDTNNIFSITDNARAISLALPINLSLSREISAGNLTGYNYATVGDTWFFPEEKIVIVSVCYTSNLVLYPELFKLDLKNKQLTKIFPIKAEDITLINSNGILPGASSIKKPLLTYDNNKNEFLFSVVVNNTNLVELVIKNLPEPYLKFGKVYKPADILNYSPYISQDQLQIPATQLVPFTHQINATGSPSNYTIVDPNNLFTWVTVNNSGLFTGTPPTPGNFYIPFFVTNSFGPIYYSLNITVT